MSSIPQCSLSVSLVILMKEIEQLSWLPPKLVPLLVRRRSAFNVTGLLAIADPLLIFHLFCLCFTHLVSIPQLHVHYLTLCFPLGVCACLFTVSSVRCLWAWCYLHILTFRVKFLVLLISAVLRLTPLHQLHPDHYTTLSWTNRPLMVSWVECNSYVL